MGCRAGILLKGSMTGGPLQGGCGAPVCALCPAVLHLMHIVPSSEALLSRNRIAVTGRG